MAPEEYDSGGPFDEELVALMKAGDVTEVTLTQYPEEWEDKDATLLGSYSMKGFIEAYEAIGRARPVRPEFPAQAASRPVLIDGVSVVEGPPRYYEFSLTGPFFAAHKPDKLTIRGILGDYNEYIDTDDEESMAQYSPELLFFYDSRRWKFYRNGAPVDNFGYVDRYENTGTCLDPKSIRLKLLIYA